MLEKFKLYTARVRVGDLNYGNHLAHDKLVSLIHDSRVWYLSENNLGEWLPEKNLGLVITSLNVTYLKEAFLGEELSIEMFQGDFSRTFFELRYSVSKSDGAVLATASTKMVTIDLLSRKIRRIPEEFLSYFMNLNKKVV